MPDDTKRRILIPPYSDVNPTPEEQEYLKELSNIPTPEDYRLHGLRKVLAMISAGATGVVEGPTAGARMGQELATQPYQRAVQMHKMRLEPLQAAVELQRERQKMGLDIERTQASVMSALARMSKPDLTAQYEDVIKKYGQDLGPKIWARIHGHQVPMTPEEELQHHRALREIDAQVNKQYERTPEEAEAIATAQSRGAARGTREGTDLEFERKKAAARRPSIGESAARAAAIAGAKPKPQQQGRQLSPSQLETARIAEAEKLAATNPKYAEFVVRPIDPKTQRAGKPYIVRKADIKDKQKQALYDLFMTELDAKTGHAGSSWTVERVQ
jgi:hypothetical protein